MFHVNNTNKEKRRRGERNGGDKKRRKKTFNYSRRELGGISRELAYKKVDREKRREKKTQQKP